MDSLISFFINRQVIVRIIIFFIFIAGILVLKNLKKEAFPPVVDNKIIISTLYPGASPKDVEINVTRKIEDALDKVPNIKELLSSSGESLSIITVIADDHLSEDKFYEVYNQVGHILVSLEDLPSEAKRPTHKRLSSDDLSILEISLSSKNKDKLYKNAEYIYSRLKKIEGISYIEKIGMPDEEYQIEIDPQKAAKQFIDLRQIVTAIKNRNLQGSGGDLETDQIDQKIVVFNKYQKPHNIMDTNIRRNFNGKGVKIREIGTFRKSYENLKLDLRNNGHYGISFAIKKSPSADLIKTIDQIKSDISSLKISDDIRINYYNDESQFTRNRTQLLTNNAIMGIILVFLMLLCFFNFKTAFWTSFSIPLSFLGAFIIFPFFGISINAITLGGLVLVLGMLVDDAIVVAEQIHIERKVAEDPKKGTLIALKKVYPPILGASLTTIVAYFPMIKIGGLPGKFIWTIPAVIGITLFVSLFDTFFLLPSHLTFNNNSQRTQNKKEQLVKKAESFYEYILDKIHNFKYQILGIFISLLVITLFMAKKNFKFIPFPQKSADSFNIQIKLPPGSHKTKMLNVITHIEKKLKEVYPHEIVGISSKIGTISTAIEIDRGSNNNHAIIFIYLNSFENRNQTAEDIINNLRTILPKNSLLIKNQAHLNFELKKKGPPLGKPFEIRITAKTKKERELAVNKVKVFLKKIKGIYGIEDDSSELEKEINLLIDYNKISELGADVKDVMTIVKISFDGLIVSEFNEGNKNINYRIKINDKNIKTVDHIGELSIINKNGNLIKLKNFVTFIEQQSSPKIYHINKETSTSVFGQFNKKVITTEKIYDLLSKNFISNDNVWYSLAGEPIETKKIFGQFTYTAIFSLLGIFCILCIILDSYALPLIVMSVIPFGIIGIFWTIYICEMELSAFVMISVLGLSGIIINDSLVMVYTINESFKKHKTIESIIISAKGRLRPVMLTTCTTVIGLLPTGYSVGGYDPFITPMCFSLAYGLFFGTLITLILIPTLYFIKKDFIRSM